MQLNLIKTRGSWLNLAEIEIGVFERECLNRRSGDEATLKREVALEEAGRNSRKARINWQFTITKAREKMRRVYPRLT